MSTTPIIYTKRYDNRTNCTELTILTSDKELYYSKYNLADKSEYFNNKFNGKLGDAKDSVIDMKEYASSTVELLLNIIDDSESIINIRILKEGDEIELLKQLLKLLNYYQFNNLLRKVIRTMENMTFVYPITLVNMLEDDEFTKGVCGKEFRDFTSREIKFFVNNIILGDTNKAYDVLDTLDNLKESIHRMIQKELVTKIISHKKI